MNLAIVALLGVCGLDCKDLPEHTDVLTVVAHKTSEGDVLEIQTAYFPEVGFTAYWLTFTPHGAKPRTIWWKVFGGRIQTPFMHHPFGFVIRKRGTRVAIGYFAFWHSLYFEEVDLRNSIDLCEAIGDIRNWLLTRKTAYPPD